MLLIDKNVDQDRLLDTGCPCEQQRTTYSMVMRSTTTTPPSAKR